MAKTSVASSGEITIGSTSFAEFGEMMRARVTRVLPNRPGFVYLITDGELVKIGKANSVPSRVNQLQTGNPRELWILAHGKFQYPQTAEAELHACLEKYRKRGEWFSFPESILDDVCKCVKEGRLPDIGDSIRWDGLIEKCKYCCGRVYECGTCFGCGESLPKRTRLSQI